MVLHGNIKPQLSQHLVSCTIYSVDRNKQITRVDGDTIYTVNSNPNLLFSKITGQSNIQTNKNTAKDLQSTFQYGLLEFCIQIYRKIFTKRIVKHLV